LKPGKLTVISQFATHWPPAASESAAARIRLGNISPSRTHTTGPHDIPNAVTNVLAASSAKIPAAPVSTGSPEGPTAAVPKTTASAEGHRPGAQPAADGR
jgi:hypothetical protein